MPWSFLLNHARSGLRDRLIRSAGGSFLAKIAFQGFSLVIGLMLARMLGAEGYGAYAYALAWISLFSVFSLLGFDRLLVREVAIYKLKTSWPELRGILRWTNLVALMTGLTLGLLAFSLIPFLEGRLEPQITMALRVGALMLPFAAMAKLRQAAMQGLGHLATGLVPEMIIQPALFIFLVVIWFAFLQLSVAVVMGLQLSACVAAYYLGALQLRRKIPAQVKSAQPVYRWKSWIKSGLPILFVGGVGIINARVDTLMLGALTSAASVGIYVVAARGAEIILLVLVTANAAISPVIAELYQSDQKYRLQQLVVRSSRMVLLGALPIAAAYILLGPRLLAIFGQEFVGGYRVLVILSISQMLHVMIGSALPLLVMTGCEMQAAAAVASGALLNLVLNWLLIPLWGMEGAALASGLTMVTSTLILSLFVRRRLDIRAHPFHRIRAEAIE